MRRDYNNHYSFYDDASYVDDLPDNRYRDDSQYRIESFYSEYGREDLMNQTPYVTPARQLYDPNNMREENESFDGGMYGATNPIEEPHNGSVFPNSNPQDFSKDARIRELKNEINEHESEFEAEKRPRSNGCCGCCPTSRKGKLIVLFIVLFFLGILGILAYVYFPKPPEFEMGVTVKNDVKLEFQQIPEKNSFRIKYALDLRINVTNNNRYDIKSEKITIFTYISPDMTALSKTKYPGSALRGKNFDREVGTAEEVGQKIFLSQRMTRFNLTLNVDFSPDEQYGIASDPILGEILRVCHPDAIAKREMMTIIYIAYADVALLQKIGLPPIRKVESTKISCPLGGRYAAELFKDPMLARFVQN
jgi:hypothetical protein